MPLFEIVFRAMNNNPFGNVTGKYPSMKLYQWCNGQYDIIELVLQKKLGFTSGNLSSHLRKLEELGLIQISKSFVKLRPTTFAVLTKEGAERLRSQMVRMRELVSMVVDKETKSEE